MTAMRKLGYGTVHPFQTPFQTYDLKRPEGMTTASSSGKSNQNGTLKADNGDHGKVPE